MPVKLAAAANISDWVNLKSYAHLLIIFYKAAVGTPSTNTLTVADSAQKAILWVIEARAYDFDETNGFNCVRANLADVDDVEQLGCLLYVLGEPRQRDTPMLNPSVLA